MTTTYYEGPAVRLLEFALDCLRDVADPEGDPSCRRVLRYATALVPQGLDQVDTARLLQAVAGNPRLTLEGVLRALSEEPGEEKRASVALWRAVVARHAEALAEHAASRVGGGWVTLGIDGTPAGDDPDAADVEYFAERHGVSVGYAVTLMARAASSEKEALRIAAAGARCTARATLTPTGRR